MTDPESKRIYIPTEAEVDAISGFEPGDQLVEYYSAAERLRIGYLATQNETYNDRVTGPMQYADSERLAELGGHVVGILNDSFENEWNGAYILVTPHGGEKIITKRGIDNPQPYPQKASEVKEAHLRFRGEGYAAFNNYHDPEEYLLKPLEELTFYGYDGGYCVMQVPVVRHENGDSRIQVQFVAREKQGSRLW